MTMFYRYATHTRGVTMLDGDRGKEQVRRPMFEPEVFLYQMQCIEENTCDIVGTFRRLTQSFGAPIVIRRTGNCAPFPLVRP